MTKKPTILYLCIDPKLAGSTASLFNLLIEIKEEVNAIVLFTEKGDGYELFTKNGIECHIYPFIKLHELRRNRLFDNLRHLWRWHYIKKIRFDYGCWFFIKKILNGRRVDIVHSNASPNDIGVLLSRNLSAKHIWHVREMLDLHFNVDIYGGLPRLRSLINSADARIAISTAIKQHWQMPDKNSFVINDAVRSQNDTSYVAVKDKYLLFCSYCLTEPKGTREAITAFAKSGVTELGYSLKLIGNCDSDYKDLLVETADQYCILKDVEFLPCQKNVKPWFEHATAYIMASKNEGLGRVTAEAMFFGCPVIAHASGGTLDIVNDNETGYLYKTIDECAQLIRKVCSENQEQIILRAQNFAVNNLSQEVYGPKIIEVYEKILES